MIVFLDRDGVINEMGEGYITEPDKLELIPGSGKAIRKLNEMGLITVVVTNQSIVGQGKTTHAGVRRLHHRIDELLNEHGAELDHYLYGWGTRETPCKGRKPNLGMFHQAQAMYDFDPVDCWLVGDNKTDIEFGNKAGMRTILVLTGVGQKWYPHCHPDFVCDNLLQATQIIQNHLENDHVT